MQARVRILHPVSDDTPIRGNKLWPRNDINKLWLRMCIYITLTRRQIVTSSDINKLLLRTRSSLLEVVY